MNIDNNIGGSAHHGRSQQIEKRQSETVVQEAQPVMRSGDKLSFVNVLESTSLANVLWTVNSDTSPATVQQDTAEQASPFEALWVRQAYTEH